VLGQPLEREYTLFDLLRRPDVTHAGLLSLAEGPETVDAGVAEQVEIDAKYEGYIERQREEIARQAQYENVRLPQSLDYSRLRGLSVEVQQNLGRHRPETIGQAARISGVTPAAVSILLVYAKRGFANAIVGADPDRASLQSSAAGTDEKKIA
jgi:tRNA uridine 5-carboxymethylaminomethyl modification enzyme